MKANELRLGNYLFDDTNRYFQVKLIGKKCLHSYRGFIYDLDDVNPIPLTEEILLNFKGVKEKKGSLGKYYYFEPYLLLRFYFHDGKLVAVKQEYNKSIWLKDIEFVHTFQNFFYTLTNQELDLTL